MLEQKTTSLKVENKTSLEDFPFMVAIGAVLKKMHEGTVQHIDLTRLEDFLITERPLEAGHPPLNDFQLPAFSSQPNPSSSTNNPPIPTLANGGKGGFVKERQEGINSSLPWVVDITRHSLPRTRAYLGIDIGSISTNLALIDEHGRLLSKRYLMTAGRPIEAVRRGLAEVGDEIGDSVRVLGVAPTGSGRYMIADFVGADIVKNEITAQATAAASIDPEV